VSQIEVVTAAVEEMAGRLSGISPETSELHGQAGTHATAAANTPAHEAMSGLMARWATSLPQFAEAGAHLQAAMHGAAQAYSQSDAAVATAAESGDKPS
jgi:uncharacterized protein YukE